MFCKFTTIKGEKFTLNICCIKYFTTTKKGTLIVCDSGMDYEVIETYEEIKEIVSYFCREYEKVE